MSKEFTSTPVWADVQTILDSGQKSVHYEYRGMLHTEKEDIAVMRISSIVLYRDFFNMLGDRLVVSFTMLFGDYVTRLYPFRNNLEFTIKDIELGETSSSKKENSTIYTERYKAVFMFEENPKIAGTGIEINDYESLNKAAPVTVKLELLDRSLEPLRIKTTSGIFRQTTPLKVITSVLLQESYNVLVDGKPAVDGISVYEPSNNETLPHIVLPTGINITSIPTYLQENQTGVYTGGIGTYLQRYNGKKIWFVYPFYQVERFDKKLDKAIIYSVPKERLPGIDRTYNKDGSVVSIIATGDKNFTDNADVGYINKGVGFRMPEGRSFMRKPVLITEEGPVADRTRLNFEVITTARKDGLNYAPMKKASSNPYKEYSDVLARSMTRVDLVWENANPRMIYPGMPCKYVYVDKAKTIELKGTIIYVEAFTSLQGNSMTSKSYRTAAQLTLIVEKPTFIPSTPIDETYGTF